MTVHGGDGASVVAAHGLDPDAVLDLSASLNPVPTAVAAIVASHLDALGRYPDPRPATLALARALDVDERRLVLTNGGAEAIALVAAELGAGWVGEPDFALYGRHLSRIDPDAPRWRSDPHNPSGRLASLDEQAGVWDEAFYPLATARWTSGRADGGAIVLGSLTKVLACPGLRIGYVLADPDLVAAVSRRQPQWAVNGLAASALPDLLAAADLAWWADEVTRLRGALVDLLRQHGFTPSPSDANYVLVPDAGGLRDALVPHGIVIRDCASFGLPGTVRIAVPGDDDRKRLAVALESR